METNPKLILYVEDDADDQEFLCDAIAKQASDVKVILAENGLKALHCLCELKETKSQLPDLIVLDINMPFLDGREMYEKIKEDKALQKVPIIVFSSSSRPNDKAMFNSLGIEFFTKPTDMSYFDTIVSHMIKVCE